MNSYIQLSMPFSDLIDLSFVKSATDVSTGEHVVYRGFVSGGPTNGTRGIVKQKYAKKAVVDMGSFGMWNIPYFLLYPSLVSEII